MYGIDIFDNIKMTLDWHIIYFGIKHDFLNMDIAKTFVYRKIECNDHVSEEELDLAWNFSNKLDILECIEKILSVYEKTDSCFEIAKDKIRIAIIIHLYDVEKNVNKLFELIEAVYADFDYPVDMECFIPYMPVNDEYISSQHNYEENINYLLFKLNTFIDEQVKKYQLIRT